jgi:hypothetical protein
MPFSLFKSFRLVAYLTRQAVQSMGSTYDIMAENKTQDYWEDDNDGHEDTRERNFECENKDEHLGCNMGIDVAG